ncbi:hypothetical protein MGYG_02694 [Nannizzia gypsea CBS 118893]|uniref:Uncharacterized protein n=2 Tax=Arthroderma gypseum TaxID=63402 RepID=E4UNS8_ARTGP|nr:hypothetical protein MGYG_02694 [Nannizzia gypsea CBS 118893]EFQ99681.1 hypothetical protein MGYG_02694 [Nannizzia gypsea CBS 118893]CBL43273.1 TPA: arylamine N-acetyltransferase 2 [Nannizzia gypsea]
MAFRDALPCAYSTEQVAAWLRHISLPADYDRYIADPASIPKTFDSLRTLFRCQITTFPYENLSVHYSPTHLVNIRPDVLYTKMLGPYEGGREGRGGYCMELSIFFHHMLRAIGFDVYMTGIRNRTRTEGVPSGEYQGWTHINNIVHLPSGEKFSVDVAFGGDGPTSPMRMVSGHAVQNLGPQEVRLVNDHIPKQRLTEPKLWIYQYRNGPDREWNSFYSFAEIEFFQEDFEVQNWWTSAKTLHRWTVLVVRFLRDGEPVKFEERKDMLPSEANFKVAGKVMMVNDVVKLNMGGKTSIIYSFETEEERLKALWDYFGIKLTQDEIGCIKGWDMALK